MFGFDFHGQKASQQRISPATAHVVARVVPAAPCGWLFFDGGETTMETEDGVALILPGGAFFPHEARRFASEAVARAEAERLNDASPCADRPWQAKPASGFQMPRRTEDILKQLRVLGH